MNETDKSGEIAGIYKPTIITPQILKKLSNTKSDYHQKLIKAYHKELENKLLLFKTRKSKISPFSVVSFVEHLNNIFDLENKKSTPEVESPSNTCEILITDPKQSLSFTFSSLNGLADVNESYGIIDKDDDFKLEEHLVELIFYFYLLNDENISPARQELLSISSSNGTFSVLNAIEKFSKLLTNLDFHPHIFKEKPKYTFSPFVQSDFVCSIENVKGIVSNLVPRFFSSRVVMYLSSPRNIDNSALMEDCNEFEQLIESDPENIEIWINFALAVLPTNLTLDNINMFEKDSFEKCLSVFSRALETKTDCDELWICYLDFFSYHSDYDAAELADMFSCASEYFSAPSLISFMYISNVRDFNTKISLAKNLLQTSSEKIDIESTERAIFSLIMLYQNAKYNDCCESLIFGLFFNEFTDIQTLMQYDDSFFTLPESFQHKSFVNSFIKALLWACVVHFLFYGCLPHSLFFEYPYECFADLYFEFCLKLDHSNLKTEKEQILKQSKYALEYLLHENENSAMLKINIAQLSNVPFVFSSQGNFTLNQLAPNSPIDYFNQGYAVFIKHFIQLMIRMLQISLQLTE